jgi:VCBS repeat-containing protein
VFLSFQAQGTWVYAVSPTAQQQIKQLISGKTKLEALQLLATLPGVEHASIRFDGFGDETRMPRDILNIHFQSIVLNR